jgi:hypothetical protein
MIFQVGAQRQRDFTDRPLKPREPRARDTPDTERTEIFAAMPFTSTYDDVYFIAMVHAAAGVNAVCRRIDQEDFDGDIVERIKHMIGSSSAVIVDLSESKPNVLYETGFAHALGLPTVHICSTPIADLPFDVRNWNTLRYQARPDSQVERAPKSAP